MTPSMKVDADAIASHLPGEPGGEGVRGLLLALRFVQRVLIIAVLLLLLSPLWFVYLLGLVVAGRPPHVPRAAQVARYLRRAFTESPPPPGLSLGQRVWLALTVLRKVAFVPLVACAWWLDELLYGRALDAVVMRAPLFEISAGRSGSTQLARYLEDDPVLAAPSFLQSVFPYLWLWRLVPRTLGRFVSVERARHEIERRLPPEFAERHEADPFRTDTFEVALYVAHLNHLSLFYGPDMANEEFAFCRLLPTNRGQWDEDFVALLERIGRKRLLEAGPGPGGKPRRLFVKGHFLCAAPALAQRFPDARFLTVLRDPVKRLQSAINYVRANPIDATLGAPPWPWLAEGLLRAEVEYCEVERAWYTAPAGPIRCVVRFDDYVRDLGGTMEHIYATCMDGPVPGHVPRQHPRRRRHAYRLDRSLAQCGIDATAIETALADYRAWCRGAAAGDAASRVGIGQHQ